MNRWSLVGLSRIATLLWLSAGCATSAGVSVETNVTELVQERTTTLHVGQLAMLRIPSDPRYSQFRGMSSPDQALALVRNESQAVIYRAVSVGPHTIVMAPDVGPGECISCATIHYFVNVVPNG